MNIDMDVLTKRDVIFPYFSIPHDGILDKIATKDDFVAHVKYPNVV